jgi:hypothetical protein
VFNQVRTAVKKSVSVYLSLRRDQLPRRNSAFSSVFVGAEQGSVERARALSTTTQPPPIVEQKPLAWRKCWLKMATDESKSQEINLDHECVPLPE